MEISMHIKELREQQARIATNARAKFDEIKDDTTEDRAAEIEREFDAMMADHDKIGAKIERLSKLEEAEDRANEGDPRKPRGADSEARGVQEEKAPEYRDVFRKMIQTSMHGLDELTPQERQVLRQGHVKIEGRAQSTTTTAGGYTIPEGFSGEIDKAMAAWGPMWDANIVREYNTASGNAIPWPTVDDTANTGRIKSENSAVDDDGTDDVVFGQKQLDAYMYDTGAVRFSWELLQDSAFNIESMLNELFAERLGRLANSVLTTGTGSSQPNGIVTASSVGKTTASATAFTADELIDLLHSVDPAYRASPKCRWMFSDDTMARIRKLKDGQGNYLWQMGDVRVGEPNSILGHPYSINQAMANLGTNSPDGGEKPIIFGDFGRYVVRKVIGFQTITLRELYAASFQVGVIGYKRFDGELLNTGAVKHMLMTGG